MTSSKMLALYHEVRARAVALYPVVFTPRGTAPVPLQRGIVESMSALREEVGEQAFRHFIRAWTCRPEYLAVLAAGGPRHALDGTEDGFVTPEEMEGARTRMSMQKVHARTAVLSTLEPEERARRERQFAAALARNRAVKKPRSSKPVAASIRDEASTAS